MNIRSSTTPGVLFGIALAVVCLASCAAPTPAATATLAHTAAPTLPPPPTATAEPTAKPPLGVVTSESGETLTLLWQTDITGDAALGGPVDVAVDDEGNTYVTGQGSKNIKKFDSEGNLAGQWGGFGGAEGKFNLATGIDVDSQGNVYIDDFQNMRVQKFDSNGTFLLQWPIDPANSPGSISVDDHGNVFVSMFRGSGDNLQKFDAEGNFITRWGGSGGEPGQFAGRIEDIAIDADSNVYVSDPFNYRIQKFDSDGNFLMQIGGQSSEEGNGNFYNPKGIAIDPQGNIYVMDNYFLQKFDAQGNFITQWSTNGGHLDRAGFLQFDSKGDLYVLAYANIVSPTGDTVSVLVLKKFQPD